MNADTIRHTPDCTGGFIYLKRGSLGDVMNCCKGCGKVAVAPAGTGLPDPHATRTNPRDLVVPGCPDQTRGWRNSPGTTRNRHHHKGRTRPTERN